MTNVVTQADRDAAADYMALISAMKGKYDPVAMAFMDPICDDMAIVQAFAAHRLAAEAGIVAWLRTMPDKIETPTVVPASGFADEDGIEMPEHTVTRVSFHKPSELADAIERREHAGEG